MLFIRLILTFVLTLCENGSKKSYNSTKHVKQCKKQTFPLISKLEYIIIVSIYFL